MPYTLNYNLSKPIIGGDIDRWGQEWNDNADKLETSLTGIDGRVDTLEASMTTVLGQYVRKDGSVAMTGRLTLSAGPLVDLHAATKKYVDDGITTLDTAVDARLDATEAVANGALSRSGGGTVSGATTFSSNLTVSAQRIYIGGTTGYFYYNSGTNTAGWSLSGSDKIFWNTSTGAFTAAGDITAFSDRRLKTDIRTIENALDLVRKMRGVRYTRRGSNISGVGVIAQEMQEVLPEVVHGADSGTLSVAYQNIVGVLIEAVKELSARVDDLEKAQ